MESTGSYWKPLYNIFELSGLDAIVANARDIKNVPGRKTDIGDAEWNADLLKHGLIKASYIPTREQRELRELSRYRVSLVQERAREINRLQKMLEGGNVKLANVVTDINGRSSRNLIKAMLESDGPFTEEQVQGLVHGRLSKKVDAILKAMNGFLTPLQKELIRKVVDHIDDVPEPVPVGDRRLTEAADLAAKTAKLGTNKRQVVAHKLGQARDNRKVAAAGGEASAKSVNDVQGHHIVGRFAPRHRVRTASVIANQAAKGGAC